MFTIEQRDALRQRVLRLAEDDDRVVAGAAVGSLAVDEGDRFSDLDQTHVDTVAPESLRAALAASVSMLMHEGTEADLLIANVVAERIAELR